MNTPSSSRSKAKNTTSHSFHLHKADHDPRAAALIALSRVLSDGVDSQAAVDDALQPSTLVPTDKRLCTELVYGVLRHYLRLDWFTCRFLSKPEKLPQEMRLTLLVALYEMNFLRIPAHASVDWAVTHIRNRFGQGLSKVANGVLRNMQRSLVDFYKPGLYTKSFADEAERLACFYAMPLWIVRLWIDSYGLDEALLLLKASQDPAPSGLRLNRSLSGWEMAYQELLELDVTETRRGGKGGKGNAKEVSVLRTPRAPSEEMDTNAATDLQNTASELRVGTDQNEAPVVPAAIAVGGSSLAFPGALPWQGRVMVKEGKASRQSGASYAVLDAFSPETWPQPVWDCCAGRGGKSLALLEQGIEVVFATDTSQNRLSALEQEYARLHLTEPKCPVTLVASAALLGINDSQCVAENCPAWPADLPHQVGTVLLDVPCSGLGTLSRHPEIRLRRTKDDIAALCDTQRQLLVASWSRVKAGGKLVYLTCTRNPAENEQQIAWFLSNNSDAVFVKEYQTPTDSLLREFFYGAMIEKK